MRQDPSFPNFVFCYKCYQQVRPAWHRRMGPVLEWHTAAQSEPCPGSTMLAFADYRPVPPAQPVKFYVDKRGKMIEWECWTDIGMGIPNMRSFRREAA